MSKKYLNIILILIFVALASRFINISSFLSETDDQLPIAQLLKYDELNLYDLANDQSSATYESKSKKFLRNLENKENRLINFFKILFQVLFLIWLRPSILLLHLCSILYLDGQLIKN